MKAPFFIIAPRYMYIAVTGMFAAHVLLVVGWVVSGGAWKHAAAIETAYVSSALALLLLFRFAKRIPTYSIKKMFTFIAAVAIILGTFAPQTRLRLHERRVAERVDELGGHCIFVKGRDGDLEYYTQPRFGARLCAIDITGARIERRDAQVMASLSDLQSLLLISCDLSPGCLEALSSASALETLSLNGTAVSDDEIAFLTRSTQLTHLYLRGAPITDAGATSLVKFARLRELDLSYTAVAGKCLNALSELRELRVLYLECTRTQDDGLQRLRTFTALRRLDVSQTGVTNEGVAGLSGLPSLEYIRAARTSVTALVSDDLRTVQVDLH